MLHIKIIIFILSIIIITLSPIIIALYTKCDIIICISVIYAIFMIEFIFENIKSNH